MALQRASLSSRRLRGELFGTRGERALVLLQAAWPGAVGEELARRTEVVALEGRTLRVRVPDASWRKVLHRMRDDILSRLEDVAGDFAPRRLGFMEGPLRGTPAADSPVTSPAPPTRVAVPPPGVRDAALTIPDPDLRDRFLASAARYLDRAQRP